MKKLLSIFLTVAMCFSLTTINDATGANNVLNSADNQLQSIDYNVEAISKIALFNANTDLLNDGSRSTDAAVASMGNKLATIDSAEAASIDLIKVYIRNNTINGFVVELTPGHGGFEPFVGGGDANFGQHGESSIPYGLVITRTITETTRGTDVSTGWSNNILSQAVDSNNAGAIRVADVSDISGQYEVIYDVTLNVSNHLGKFQMAGAYEESFTLTYTDNFGAVGGNY